MSDFCLKKVLFIGNSATERNDIPNTFAGLARRAGYGVEPSVILQDNAKLAEFADPSGERGQMVLRGLEESDYDIVFLQGHSGCFTTEQKRQLCIEACKVLDDLIKKTGAKTYFYVRPPLERDLKGYDTYSQCVEYDKLFKEIATDLGATNVYVNRAFAYAMKNLDVKLWGPDNAHTSIEGAYLVACVFFATVFNTTATLLDSNGLPEEIARSLQKVADKVALEGFELQY